MRLGKKKTQSEQDTERGQKGTSEKTAKQEQESKQEEENTGTEQKDQSEEGDGSLNQVLDLLKQADLINMDASLKSLVKEGKIVPPKEWGLLVASGHWLLIWRRKGL
ncbi:hypothetical protein [Dictyobacter aurantiacus]|uniref:Uncharacterized protein n=1 Tax=Dictyobacter aurantiacus TaxID=1936993 RepID=A0A401ZGT5_9CHLR|nr:hypothetical protein [Dictyobacter aurantiacus]GCE06062.1 hypothetical protein KDAU_33910 [Dictyobacter aurantiacus]